MITKVTIDNMADVYELQKLFNVVFRQKDELIDTLTTNPYVQLYTYSIDKKVVGFIEYSIIYDRYELDNIYVLEEYRNKGIASCLISFMINEAQDNNITNITLEVRIDNDPALRLYVKYGFVKKAIRHNYYGDCDGILMEKEMM